MKEDLLVLVLVTSAVPQDTIYDCWPRPASVSIGTFPDFQSRQTACRERK